MQVINYIHPSQLSHRVKVLVGLPAMHGHEDH